MAQDLIILGASARAAAGSAIRAGYRPWCIDLFTDRDLAAVAPVRRCPPDRYPDAMVAMLDDAPIDAPVLLTGAMENYPDVLRAIAARRPLLDWTVDQITALRNPELCAPPVKRGALAPARPLLAKPRHSAAGRNVRFWHNGDPLADDEYLQPFYEGVPISAVFRGRRCLGATRQIIGDEHLGASGFQYAGSIGPIDTPPDLARFGQQLADRFNLTGLFGIDAILDASGNAHPIEINPRYTASVEVLERAANFSALAPQAGAEVRRSSGSPVTPCAKAYVFARHSARVADLYDHFAPHEIADVPAPGSVVQRGQPICTLLADTADLAHLHALADRLYTRCLRDAPTVISAH